jgi:hypothetical protein
MATSGARVIPTNFFRIGSIIALGDHCLQVRRGHLQTLELALQTADARMKLEFPGALAVSRMPVIVFICISEGISITKGISRIAATRLQRQVFLDILVLDLLLQCQAIEASLIRAMP